MTNPRPTPVRIGIYGPEESSVAGSRGCSLWPVGYVGALTAAGATPVPLPEKTPEQPWDELLRGLDGVVITASRGGSAKQQEDEARLCEWCLGHRMPVLGVDQGMHVLNLAHGGSLYLDLGRELPEALQHRHPPERGLRHAITVDAGTYLAAMYGDGEVVVNSEHRTAVQKVARGFRVCARALDGVIEAIEAESEAWFAVGVQWRPASASASGLDIQLFRGLVDECVRRQQQKASRGGKAVAA